MTVFFSPSLFSRDSNYLELSLEFRWSLTNSIFFYYNLCDVTFFLIFAVLSDSISIFRRTLALAAAECEIIDFAILMGNSEWNWGYKKQLQKTIEIKGSFKCDPKLAHFFLQRISRQLGTKVFLWKKKRFTPGGL